MILDTNAVSAFANGDQGVREAIAAGAGPYLPVVVIGEYLLGLMSSRDRSRRMAWLEELIRSWTVLDIASDTAAAYADIRHTLKQRSNPLPSNDVWIAALARQHDLPVLSADTHFDAIPGLERIDW